jgi:hypothetical protein
MVQIQLNREKAEWLREILGNDWSQLRQEIANTDNKDFREFLETRSEFMEEFLRELEGKLASEQTEEGGVGELRHAA